MNLKVTTVTHGGEQLSKAAFLVIQTALQGTLQGRHGYFMVVVYRFACLLYGRHQISRKQHRTRDLGSLPHQNRQTVNQSSI